jgi:outer membrane protein assembly factor BamB
VWAAKGYWTGQHDPHILEDGNILLFDNRGNFRKPEGRSRAIEFNPETMQVVWQYAGTMESPLDSDIRSYTQRLQNGNTLITESNGGRILEVTADQEIVWEYTNPVRGGPDNAKIPIICKALRLDARVAAAFLHASLET